jgi:cephalosporin-C deacetylase-like acetyl esterase
MSAGKLCTTRLHEQEAVIWLSNHPLVLKNGIGVVGVSKGAGLALQMAIMSDLVRELCLDSDFVLLQLSLTCY